VGRAILPAAAFQAAPGVWTFSELTGVEEQGDECLLGGLGQ